MNGPLIEVERVAGPLRDLGLQAGDAIGLHSNVPSLGRIMVQAFKAGGDSAVERAVNDVVDGFVAVVDRDSGTLCVPTFSYCFLGREGAGAYDPKTTPSRVGMLTDLFFRRPDAVRSLHPTHSVAAIGARAEELVAGHENLPALGVDSPFHRLAQWNGWICYLGTNGNTLSLLHVAEAIAEVPYLDVFRYEHVAWKNIALIHSKNFNVQFLDMKISTMQLILMFVQTPPLLKEVWLILIELV